MAVHDDHVELILGGKFGLRGGQPTGHDFGGFGAAADESLLECFAAGRGEEDGQRVGHGLFHRPGTCQIDFDQHWVASGRSTDDGLGQCAGPVQTTVDLGPLQQITGVDELLKALGGHKVVVVAVDLARTWRPSGRRHTEVQVGHLLSQAPHDRRLTDRGRAGQHQHATMSRWLTGRNAPAVRPTAGVHGPA